VPIVAKASVKTVDMSGVKDRGSFNPRRVAEGDYAAIITKVEDGETKENKEFQYIFTIKLEKFSQNSYPYYCKLTENQLWKIRNLMIAAGVSVPKKRMKLDPNKAVSRKVGVTMADDEYEGKMKSVIDAIFPVSELADGAEIESDDEFDEDSGPEVAGNDDAEEPAPKKKKAKADSEPAGKKGKKSKKKKGGDSELEDLDISDV
jgi:hypothetical protein